MKLSRAASFWLLATVFAFFLFAAGAPSPLYVVYEAMWHFSSLTLTAIFVLTLGLLLVGIPQVFPHQPEQPQGAQRPMLAQHSQRVVEQFYQHINARDYTDAYSQWGTDFHSTTEYCSFVEGYSRTRSDDVHIDNTTQLSNGTVQVVATVNATEETNSGTTMKVYHETYIAGQEYGTWRIISGTQI